MKTINDTAAQDRKYFEDNIIQVSKKTGDVCGDHWVCERTPEYTTFILCDGMGSGIKANIAAVMCASRLLHLINYGLSLHQACQNVISTMHRARTEDIPFSAFTAVRVLCNGQYTCITYEMPSPVFIEKAYAYPLSQRFYTMSNDVVGESTGVLKNGDFLVITSDGVSQAGMGENNSFGWTMNGFSAFINRNLLSGAKLHDIMPCALQEIWNMSGQRHGDDISIATLGCRQAKAINILTGLPASNISHKEFVASFMELDGSKAVCGSSTADMVSNCTGKPVDIKKIPLSYMEPPRYQIEGIDIVTEGALTLNQLYNILDEDIEAVEESSCVFDLCRMIKASDIVRFVLGESTNPAHKSIIFKQMGVIPRQLIVPIIAEKLKSMGKLVMISKK